MYTEMSFDLDLTFSVLFARAKLTSKVDAIMSSQRLAEYGQKQVNEDEYRNIQSQHSQSLTDLFTIVSFARGRLRQPLIILGYISHLPHNVRIKMMVLDTECEIDL